VSLKLRATWLTSPITGR